MDPIKAKYLISKPVESYRTTEDEKEILLRIAKKKMGSPRDDNENVSDIEDPINENTES